jgi:hypothetical protein
MTPLELERDDFARQQPGFTNFHLISECVR